MDGPAHCAPLEAEGVPNADPAEDTASVSSDENAEDEASVIRFAEAEVSERSKIDVSTRPAKGSGDCFCRHPLRGTVHRLKRHGSDVTACGRDSSDHTPIEPAEALWPRCLVCFGKAAPCDV